MCVLPVYWLSIFLCSPWLTYQGLITVQSEDSELYVPRKHITVEPEDTELFTLYVPK